MKIKTYTLLSKKDTKKLALTLAQFVQKGCIILLQGDLGAGKTTFARLFIRSLLGDSIEVPSPTFTLVQTYAHTPFTIWHFDLYRLKDPGEAFELGLEQAYEEGVTLIEWPEKLGPYMPKEYIKLHFQHHNYKRFVDVSVPDSLAYSW